ncbi:unnamed protein product [Ectocarpus fasciculatus]
MKTSGKQVARHRGGGEETKASRKGLVRLTCGAEGSQWSTPGHHDWRGACSTGPTQGSRARSDLGLLDRERMQRKFGRKRGPAVSGGGGGGRGRSVDFFFLDTRVDAEANRDIRGELAWSLGVGLVS